MQAVNVVRGLTLDEDAIQKLHLNSPAGGWFPALQVFTWHISRQNAAYGDLFFSPCLERITTLPVWRQRDSNDCRNLMSSVASILSTLPVPSGLRILVIAALDERIRDSLPGSISKILSPPSFFIADHHLRISAQWSHCRTKGWST